MPSPLLRHLCLSILELLAVDGREFVLEDVFYNFWGTKSLNRGCVGIR